MEVGGQSNDIVLLSVWVPLHDPLLNCEAEKKQEPEVEGGEAQLMEEKEGKQKRMVIGKDSREKL